MMWWVEARFDMSGKERWEGLTYDQASSVYGKYSGRKSGAWYVRMGQMVETNVSLLR